MLVVGLASLVSFRPLFTLFHQLSFSNELWQLDPATSYLVRMFPLGFWRDATLLIGLASVVQALFLAAVGGVYFLLPFRRPSTKAEAPSATREAP